MISKWVPIAVFSAFAVYSAFGMIYGGRWMVKQQQRWQRAPRFMQVLYSIFSLGQWRDQETMKAWSFMGALFTFIGSVAVVVLLLFFVHPAHR
ncbi:MAG TPA: hypothetical protein VMT95_00015 [Candidatus Binatia bacterium]|nr:hypothetical protein [Candidatus Binatia bacterium]